MEYLKVWVSFRELLEPLTDAEKGRLFAAMLEYAESGVEPQLSGSERYVWPAARQSINNTREKSEQMKANGSKPKQTEANQSKAEQTEASLFDKDKVKDKVKEKDKDKRALTRSPRPSADVDRLFDKFWLMYPRHEGKQAARKAFDRLGVDDALLGVMVEAITRQRQSAQWSDPRYVPHPATWLNGRRWEDEPVTGTSGGKKVSAQQYEQRDYDEAELERRLGVDL